MQQSTWPTVMAAAISNHQSATIKSTAAVTEKICNNQQSNDSGSDDLQNATTINKATMTAVAGTNKMQQSGRWRRRQKHATINKVTRMVAVTLKLQQSTKRQRWRREQQAKCSNKDDGDGNQENKNNHQSNDGSLWSDWRKKEEKELVQTARKMTDEEWASSMTSTTD